jgi:hypothetical protein
MASNQPQTTLPNPQAGIKVAKAGFSTRTASDYELLFSSAWPSLSVAFSKVVTIPPNKTITVNNNLGFYAFTMGFEVDSNNNFVGRIGLTGDTQGGTLGLSIGKNNIYITGDSSATYQVSVCCYNLDITKQVNYTFISPPTAQIGFYDKHYGVKFAKPGKSINSHVLNDFILHSQCQSPAILSVVTQVSRSVNGSGLPQISYKNPNNYVPWIYGFQGSTGSIYESLIYTASEFTGQYANGLTIVHNNIFLTYATEQP